MSCEGNRDKFFNSVTAGDAAMAAQLGGDQPTAQATLDQIFHRGRQQWEDNGRPGADNSMRMLAEAKTRLLFSQMRDQQPPLDPPVHSTSGLPKPDALFGYAAVYDTIAAARAKRALPAIAQEVMRSGQHQRRLSATGRDDKGYMRCSECGRFVSRNGDHVCPRTATADTMAKALRRRAGVPAAAYSTPDGKANGLETILAAARANPAGTVQMTHNLTGEQVAATLDGVLVGLRQGFIPDAWRDEPSLAQVELANGNIVPVLNTSGLRLVQPAASANAQAAAAYGVVLQPTAPVGGADQPYPPGAAQPAAGLKQATATPAALNGLVALPGSTSIQPNPAGLYDKGRFSGSEFRKDAGAQVIVAGQTYTVGAYSSDPADWSSARRNGLAPAPRQGRVKVARTLVAAAGLLKEGKLVETDGGQVQLYDPDQRELHAAYDPASRVAGDTAGSANASPAQWAAVLGHYLQHPDPLNPAHVALADDLHDFQAGNGSALAVADSAYLTLYEELNAGNNFTMAGQVRTPVCFNCGRLTGDAHICDQAPMVTGASAPAEEATPEAAPAAPVVIAPESATPAPAIVAPQSGATAAQAGFSQVAPEPSTTTTAAPSTPQTPLFFVPPADPALVESMREMGAAIRRLARAQRAQLRRASAPVAESNADASSAAIDRLADVLAQLTPRLAAPAPLPEGGAIAPQQVTAGPRRAAAPPPPARPTRRPGDDPARSAVEHIMAHAVPPQDPDPYLRGVPIEMGGRRDEPIPLYYQAPDPAFDMSADAEKAVRAISTSLQIAWDPNNNISGTRYRAFGLYGTSGTGKNTTARQVAAALALPYTERTFDKNTRVSDEIGAVVLDHGTTRVELGPIGLAAATGQVICLNELVKAPPATLGAIQTMIEDGYIEIKGAEAGAHRIPVHPSTLFIGTWNPGYEGASDRPEAAPLSRMMAIGMSAPDQDEEARRLVGSLQSVYGQTAAGSEATTRESRRQEILGRDYKNKRPSFSLERAKAATGFIRSLRELARKRQIGGSSIHLAEPTPREAERFLATAEATGDPRFALEQLKAYCDQGENFAEEWSLVEQAFEPFYGRDGQALNRRANGAAPVVS